jgi:hypothetical protein
MVAENWLMKVSLVQDPDGSRTAEKRSFISTPADEHPDPTSHLPLGYKAQCHLFQSKAISAPTPASGCSLEQH